MALTGYWEGGDSVSQLLKYLAGINRFCVFAGQVPWEGTLPTSALSYFSFFHFSISPFSFHFPTFQFYLFAHYHLVTRIVKVLKIERDVGAVPPGVADCAAAWCIVA